jgi:hypothetical protein
VRGHVRAFKSGDMSPQSDLPPLSERPISLISEAQWEETALSTGYVKHQKSNINLLKEYLEKLNALPLTRDVWIE